MDTFRAQFEDVADPASQLGLTAQLRDHGFATLSGLNSRAALISAARRVMTIRTHRDATPDGITEITDRGSAAPGYAAFTDSALVPHTDGSSEPDAPGLLLIACVQPAAEGGATLVADGSRIAAAMAAWHPAALRSLSAPMSARFGQANAYTGAVFEPAGAGRTRIRLRLDDLVQFSADAARAVPLLRTVIARHLKTLNMGPGDAVLLSNTRWLHGRTSFAGHRSMLRILGDPLPGNGILPGFPAADVPAPWCSDGPGRQAVGDVSRRIA